MEKSIPCRKEKKIIFDKIEEAEKEKEEAEKYWKEQEEIEKKKENEDKDDKKKKEEKKKDDKNKKVYPKPEEIEIPKYDEYTNEMFVILYNYPLSEEEFMCLENEKNENNEQITINLFHLINDIDEYNPPEPEEVVLDKKGKPIQKEAKLDKDQALIQKYFSSTLLVPKKEILDTENDDKKDDEMNDTKTSKMNKKEEEKKDEEKKDDNDDEMIEVVLSDIYNKFIELKDNSDKLSKLRQCCFEKEDFTYKILNEETQEDTISEFYKNFLVKIAKMHAQFIYYQNWSKEKKLIKLLDDGQNKAKEFSIYNCISINSNVDYENDSIGRSLIAF